MFNGVQAFLKLSCILSTQFKPAKRDPEAYMNQLLVCINIVFWFVKEINYYN